MCGNWKELRADFCHSFSRDKRINSLPIDILDFKQLEEEFIDAAWVRFLCLLASSPDLSIPKDVSSNIFYSSLDMKSALDLDISSGGWFTHTTPVEKRDILHSFLENSIFATDHSEPH